MFVQSFNHEVRHPINTIQTFTQLLISEIENNQQIELQEVLENQKIVEQECKSLIFLT